jgi:hypothetical protein
MFKSRWSWHASGVALVLIVGLNVAGLWPQIPIHAVATHGDEQCAIATGPIDSNIEAVYVLDTVTGNLKAAVLNLQTGKFMSFFEHDVKNDLAVSVKNPKYLMVTGAADLRRGLAGQIGSSVLYVAEVTSGQVAAYGMPWTSGRANMAAPFKGPFILLDGFKFRTANIRQ